MKAAFRRSQVGFTLLELLIALVITAAVVTLMFAGFALIGRSEDRNQRLM
ncbi:MAG: PulJ/GspJ family protein, partial [Giesbergeria sp.]